MKNVQKPEKIHLGKLIDEIHKGRFVIPDFQREFDWEPWDVRDLIKSIFMDYYIGTLLLWENNSDNFEKLACAPLYAFKGKLDPEYIVLDGQQRLSAMHYAFFQPDEIYRKRKNRFYFYIKLEELILENYEEAFSYLSATKSYEKLLKNIPDQYEQHIFPLGLMQEGSWGIDDWIKGYRDYWSEKADKIEDEALKEKCINHSKQAIVLKDIFSDLLNNYQVSYISLAKQLELNKVCDIFTHINSKGKPLDTFDLLNSITRKEDIYLKDMYRDASKKLDDTNYPGYELKIDILRIMSMLLQNYCSPKYLYYLVPGEIKKEKRADGKMEEKVLIKNKEEFVKLWQSAVGYLNKGLKTLKNPRDLGAISKKFLPYPSIISALSSIKAYVSTKNLENIVDVNEKIKMWYWSSIFLNRYSSSVESTSTKDFMDLKKWFDDDSMVPEFIEEFHMTYDDIDLHKEVRNSSAIYRAIFNLFILKGASDWSTFDLPEYESLDDHHIVPKSWGKDNELGSSINSILNRTPLTVDTNRKIIRDQLPNVYLKNMLEKNDKQKVYAVLKKHLISEKAVEILLREPFSPEDYQEFLSERRRSIIQEIENRIINPKIELPKNLEELNKRIEQIELKLRSLIITELDIKETSQIVEIFPNHVYDKVTRMIKREKKKNPAKVQEREKQVDFWLEQTDMQELKDIISAKSSWPKFENIFGGKEKLTSEYNDMSTLRNVLRHSKEVDDIAKMKGEAAIMWMEKQLKISNDQNN